MVNPTRDTDFLAGSRGFSIVEALIGSIVLVVVLVGLSSFSGVQRKAMWNSGERTEAAHLTLTALEAYRTSLSDSAVFKYSQLSLLNGAIKKSSRVKGKQTRYDITIQQSAVVGTDKLIRLNATTKWAGRDSLNIGLLVVAP